MLPSYLKRKSVGGKNPKNKRAKSITAWDRDIICLPKQSKNGEILSVIPYPRSHYRSEFGECGLIGKVHITSNMSVEKVKQEILCSHGL